MVINTRKWWVLLGTGLCLALSFLDQTAVIVIMPTVQKSLGATTLQMEWVINAYMLVMAVLFVLGGRLGDLYGEKKIYLAGIFIFLFASILCGISSSVEMLVIARAIQGVGSALLIPAQSVIILNAFPVQERGRAMGLNLAIASVFMVIGGFVGGIIVEYFNWQTVFWINVPLSLISAGLVIWAVLPDTKKGILRHLDWVGLFWQLMSVTTLIIAIMELGHIAWEWCVALVIISALSFYILFKVEMTKKNPLFSFHIFKIKAFTTSSIMIFLLQIILVVGIFTTIFYQDVLGVSPATAGLMSLPGTLPILLMGPIGGWLLDRYGVRLPLLLGLGLNVFAYVWIASVFHLRDYWLFVPALIASGIGTPLIFTCIFTPALSAVELHNRGVASGTLGVLRQIGSSLGLAIASAIINLTNTWSIKSQLVGSGLNTDPNVVASVFSSPKILNMFSLSDQGAVIDIAKNALTVSINFAMLWAAIIVIFAWMIAFIRMRNNPGFLPKDRP